MTWCWWPSLWNDAEAWNVINAALWKVKWEIALPFPESALQNQIFEHLELNEGASLMLSRIFVTLPIVLFVFWGFGFFWNSCHQHTIMCFSVIALQSSHDICALPWCKISRHDEREIYPAGSEMPILRGLPLFLSLFTASSCWTGISYKCWYLHRAIDSSLGICLKLCVELANFYASYVTARWKVVQVWSYSVPNWNVKGKVKRNEKDPEWIWTLLPTWLMWCVLSDWPVSTLISSMANKMLPVITLC